MDNTNAKHHICPRSKGGQGKRNIAVVNKTQHDRYHTLFGNKRPDEIIDYLVTYFWGGQWHWVQKASQEIH